MTVRQMTHDEVLALVIRGRDEIAQEAFRLRRQAETFEERQRAIRWEALAVDLDEAVANLRMARAEA